MRTRGRPRRWRTAVAAVGVITVAWSAGACGSGTPTSAAPPDGAALYAQRCASCHGTDLRGTDKGPPHLSAVYAPDHHPDQSFASAIANGSKQHHWNFGDMPPVPGLAPAEVTAIIAYVRAVQQREGLQPYPPR